MCGRVGLTSRRSGSVSRCRGEYGRQRIWRRRRGMEKQIVMVHGSGLTQTIRKPCFRENVWKRKG